MSYCSRSRRHRLTVLDFKIEHIVAFTAIFSNICTAHVQKRLSMNFRCKFRHRHSIHWHRFPNRVQNFGDMATFFVNFCILYAKWPLYFYFRFVWPTDLQSIPHASTPHVDNCHQVWSWYENTLPSYSIFVCRNGNDFVTSTFDLLILSSCHTWRVTCPTKCVDPTPIRSWVMSYNVSRRLPLTRWHWHVHDAPNREWGVKNNYMFGMSAPDLPIYYATSMALRWK